MGAAYKLANGSIKIEKLKDLQIQATENNNNVVAAYSVLSPKQDSRLNSYNMLSQKATKNKDFVKSQYGLNSSEYKLVKGLKI